MRYLIVQVLSGVLLLSGAAMIFSETGSMAFTAMELGSLATWLVFIAFGFKAAFPLLNGWPAIEQRKGRLEAEGDKYQPGGERAKFHCRESHRPGLAEDHRRAGQQQHTRQHLDYQIAHGGMAGALCPRGKDQEDGGDRRRLPQMNSVSRSPA